MNAQKEMTLWNIQDFTFREIFDFVTMRVIEQGRPSVSEGSCRYRGDYGSKCAIGHLIPDEKYFKNMEGRSLLRLMELIPDLEITTKYFTFLSDLQSAHDYAVMKTNTDESFLSEFKDRCDILVREYNLNK